MIAPRDICRLWNERTPSHLELESRYQVVFCCYGATVGWPRCFIRLFYVLSISPQYCPLNAVSIYEPSPNEVHKKSCRALPPFRKPHGGRCSLTDRSATSKLTCRHIRHLRTFQVFVVRWLRRRRLCGSYVRTLLHLLV